MNLVSLLLYYYKKNFANKIKNNYFISQGEFFVSQHNENWKSKLSSDADTIYLLF